MNEALDLLCSLIAVPSPSREESRAADLMEEFLRAHKCMAFRSGNNVWSQSTHLDPAKPTILLNSHLDTVRPTEQWTRDPYTPSIEGGKLYGLGSNDAGASLAALATVFSRLAHQELSFNLVFAASAEEEISGSGGIVALLPLLPRIDAALVGEPTSLRMAIAERGLMVVRCVAEGVAGHAAHGTGINAIDVALADIAWLHSQPFDRHSDVLGTVRATVTMISAGSQHNVVPNCCQFTIDLRTTDAYTHEELLAQLEQSLRSRIESVSLRLRPSRIGSQHALVQVAKQLGIELYGSPTLSDQALLPMPSVKIGPGDSQRSHTADEFVFMHELEQGIEVYQRFLRMLDEYLHHHSLDAT